MQDKSHIMLYLPLYCACIEWFSICRMFVQYTSDGNSVHSCPKLLVAKWLGLGFSSALRARNREWTGILFFPPSFDCLKTWRTHLSCFPGLRRATGKARNGKRDRKGNRNGTGTGMEMGNGNGNGKREKIARSCQGRDHLNSQLSSSREPGMSRSKDSR